MLPPGMAGSSSLLASAYGSSVWDPRAAPLPGWSAAPLLDQTVEAKLVRSARTSFKNSKKTCVDASERGGATNPADRRTLP